MLEYGSFWGAIQELLKLHHISNFTEAIIDEAIVQREYWIEYPEPEGCFMKAVRTIK